MMSALISVMMFRQPVLTQPTERLPSQSRVLSRTGEVDSASVDGTLRPSLPKNQERWSFSARILEGKVLEYALSTTKMALKI